ncbi:putative carboxypeptidase C [Helianthus anomalus]
MKRRMLYSFVIYMKFFLRCSLNMKMVIMKVLFFCILGCVSTVSSIGNSSGGTMDGSEAWGYIEVRPRAHMFWWLYKSPNRVEEPSKPWPTILWLQGGPVSTELERISY